VPTPLNISELSEYEENGYLVLRGVFGMDELVACRREAEQLEFNQACETRVTHSSRTVTERGSNSLRSIFALHENSRSAIGQCALSKQIVSCAQQLLGDDVYVHQSRLNFHVPFHGQGFSWHSDFETWHAEDGMPTPRSLSAVIFLDRNLPMNGAIMVVPGSHLYFVRCPGRQPSSHWEQSLQSQSYGTPSDLHIRHLVESKGLQYCTGEPGDVLLFDSNLLHASHANLSPWPRRDLFVAFNADSNRLKEPFYSKQPRPEHCGHRVNCSAVHPLVNDAS